MAVARLLAAGDARDLIALTRGVSDAALAPRVDQMRNGTARAAYGKLCGLGHSEARV